MAGARRERGAGRSRSRRTRSARTRRCRRHPARPYRPRPPARRARPLGHGPLEGGPASEHGDVPGRTPGDRARLRRQQRHRAEQHRGGRLSHPRPRHQRTGHPPARLPTAGGPGEPPARRSGAGSSCSSPHRCGSRAAPVRRSTRSRSSSFGRVVVGSAASSHPNLQQPGRATSTRHVGVPGDGRRRGERSPSSSRRD